MERDFLMWPPAMKLTFASAMNLLRQKKKRYEMDKPPTIRRHDVYVNLRSNKEKFRKVFGTTEPWENAIYDYMDKLVLEGYFLVLSQVEINKKKYQELTSTPKAEELHERLWISTNLKSKDDIGKIVEEAIKNMKELDEEMKERIVKHIMDGIEKKRLPVGFPLSIPEENIKKLRKAQRKVNHVRKRALKRKKDKVI